VELVQSGAIGKVTKVDVWCERRPSPWKEPTRTSVPASLDYEMWVGPAPFREYDPSVTPFGWRWGWEFGGGVLGDMGCHFMDLAHWALNLRAPDRVSAEGTMFPDAPNKVPVEMKVDYRYAARNGQPAVDLTWWHGNKGPKDDSGRVIDLGFGSAVLFHGEKGRLVSDYSNHRLLPEAQFADFKRPDQFIPESVGHHREWVNGIKNGTPTTCNFDYSGALTEAVLLGNVSYRLGRPIEWDSKALKITNVKESEWKALVRREYRGEWKLHKG
jgi:predicted dehydrogenase